MVVVGAGTGGTISGISKKLKERLPNVLFVDHLKDHIYIFVS